MRAREVQNFTQGGDPYHKMRIGKRAQIERIIKKESNNELIYELDDELNIILDNYNSHEFLKMINELEPLVKSIILTNEIDLRHLLFNENKPLIFPKNLKKIDGMRLFGIHTDIILPDNLIIKGRLDVSYSKIKKLPENLYVGGHLNIAGTKISELPKNLHVGTYLYWGDSEVAVKYPGRTKHMIKKYKDRFWKDNIKIFMDIIP